MSNYVVSISREFGSGGRLIGKKLAASLGIPCYDRTLIQKTAEKSGLSPDFIARRRTGPQPVPPEHRPHRHRRPHLHPPGHPGQPSGIFCPGRRDPGAGGGGALRHRGPVQRLHSGGRPRLHQSLYPCRHGQPWIDRCVAEYHIPSDNMESRIIQMDRGRANYYNYYTGHTWGEMRRYDLTLNSSITGINGAVEMIAQLVRLRSAQLDQAPTQGALRRPERSSHV